MFPERLLGINGGSDLLSVLGLDARFDVIGLCVCARGVWDFGNE